MEVVSGAKSYSRGAPSLVKFTPGSVTIVELPSSYLTSTDNVVSVRSLLKDIMPENTRNGNGSKAARSKDREKEKEKEKEKLAGTTLGGGEKANTDGGDGMDIENISPAAVSETTSTLPITKKTASGATGPGTTRVGHGLNSFAAFIEEMERKYTAHHLTVGSDSDDLDGEGLAENSDETSDSDESEGEGEGEADRDVVREKRHEQHLKKRKNLDYYEYDDVDSDGEIDEDGFIDDSELGAIVDEGYRSKQIKLKHSGFFVSSGELEVLPPPPFLSNLTGENGNGRKLGYLPPVHGVGSSSSSSSSSGITGAGAGGGAGAGAGAAAGANGGVGSLAPPTKHKGRGPGKKTLLAVVEANMGIGMGMGMEYVGSSSSILVTGTGGGGGSRSSLGGGSHGSGMVTTAKKSRKSFGSSKRPSEAGDDGSSQLEPVDSSSSGLNRWAADPVLLTLPPADVLEGLVTAANALISSHSQGLGQGQGQGQDQELQGQDDGDYSVKSGSLPANAANTGATPKAYWVPNATAVRALGIFKSQAAYLKCDRLEKANSLPLALAEPLRVLDLVVQREHGVELRSQVGYLESICSLLGGGAVSVGKVKNFLYRIQCKAAADQALITLEKILASLTHDIRHATVLYVAKAKPLAPGDVAPAPAPGTASASASAGVGASSGGGGNSQSQGDSLGYDSDSNLGDTTAAGAGTSSTFKWQCKWSNKMKATLCNLDDLTTVWVLAENKKRKAMTMEEKRSAGIDQQSPFDAKEHFTILLTKLCENAFPAGCKASDPASLRRIMAQHRSIARKKQLKAIADAGVGSAILEQTMATAIANSSPSRSALRAGASSSSHGGSSNSGGNSMLQFSVAGARLDDNGGVSATAASTADTTATMKKPRVRASLGDAGSTKRQPQAPSRPFLSLEFQDVKAFDPEDFLEQIGGLSNLGGGVCANSPKRSTSSAAPGSGGGLGCEDPILL